MLKQSQNLITSIPYGEIGRGMCKGAQWTVTNPWTQGITAATVGLITAHNIVVDGMDTARENTNEEMGATYVDLFVKPQTVPRESNLLESAKSMARNIAFDNPFYPAFLRVKNVAAGLVSETFDYLPNIAAVAGVGLTFIKSLKMSENKELATRLLKINKKRGIDAVKKFAITIINPNGKSVIVKKNLVNSFINTVKKSPFLHKVVPVLATGYLLAVNAKTVAVDVLGFGKKGL